ncbi:flagellar export protein FliJ [Paenibacillus rhizoplanae]
MKGNEKHRQSGCSQAHSENCRHRKKSLDELIEQRSTVMLSLQTAAQQKTPMAKLREMQDYVDYLDKCIARKLSDISLAHIEVQSKQDQLSTKVLDEKVWLKAKDKAQTAFVQNMNLREQNELDEMATVRFAMKSL